MTQLYYPQFPINYPAPSMKSSTEMEEILMQLHLSSMKLDVNQKPIVNTQSTVQPSTSPRSPSNEFTRYAGGAFEQSPEPENLPLPSFISIKKRPMELSKSAEVSVSTPFSSESLSASDEELYDTPLSHSQTRSPSHSGRRSKRDKARSPYKGFSPARSNKSQQQH